MSRVLVSFPCTIGRDISNQLVLNNPTISLRHATLTKQGSKFILQDNNSTNGMIIRGDRKTKIKIKDKGRVKLGDLELELEVDNIKAGISGSGSINLFGKADDFTATINGSGEINAFDLETKNVSVTISGSGDCRVNVSESLNTTISGSGDIYYKGRPQISTRISGSGSLRSQD